MVYSATCTRCGNVEIEKPMLTDFPKHHYCGGQLARRYEVPAIHYNAAGFYSTDVQRMKSLVGSERYAQFEHERDAAQSRAKRGQLTPYEQAMEAVDANG